MSKEMRVQKGDLVKIRPNIKRDESAGERGFSIDSGEVGEINHLMPGYENEEEQNKVYLVVFPDDKSKQGELCIGRRVYMIRGAFDKVGS